MPKLEFYIKADPSDDEMPLGSDEASGEEELDNEVVGGDDAVEEEEEEEEEGYQETEAERQRRLYNTSKSAYYSFEEDQSLIRLLKSFIVETKNAIGMTGFWVKFAKYFNVENLQNIENLEFDYVSRSKDSLRRRFSRIYHKALDESETGFKNEAERRFYVAAKELGDLMTMNTKKKADKLKPGDELEIGSGEEHEAYIEDVQDQDLEEVTNDDISSRAKGIASTPLAGNYPEKTNGIASSTNGNGHALPTSTIDSTANSTSKPIERPPVEVIRNTPDVVPDAATSMRDAAASKDHNAMSNLMQLQQAPFIPHALQDLQNMSKDQLVRLVKTQEKIMQEIGAASQRLIAASKSRDNDTATRLQNEIQTLKAWKDRHKKKNLKSKLKYKYKYKYKDPSKDKVLKTG